MEKSVKYNNGFAPALILMVVGLFAIVALSSLNANREKSSAPENAAAAEIVLPKDPADDSYFQGTPEFDFGTTPAASTKLATKSVTVNLSPNKLNSIRYVASGFLVTSLRQPFPANVNKSFVLDLKPRLFRSQSNTLAASGDWNYQTFKNEAGGAFQVFMAADYLSQYVWCATCKGKEVWPGQGGNWQPWEQSIQTVMNRILGGGYKVEYDIWNEPDIVQFWGPRDVNRFNETWKRAFQIIRSRDPQAKIVGPSIGVYNKTYLTNFLKYAKANNVLPNILSWHELNPSHRATYIDARVKDMKSWMASQTPPIVMDGISINEILPPNDVVNSGVFIDYAQALEKAGVLTVTKSCWPEVGTDESTTNCWSYTLNGLLTRDTFQKRGIWYTYKAYADMTGRLVPVAQPAGFPAIVSHDEGQATVHVLTGNNASPSYNVNLKLSNTDKVGRGSSTYTKVAIQNIPSSGKQVLTSLPASLTFNYFITSNQVNLSLPTFSGYGAYKVVLSNVTNPYPLLIANVGISSCTSTTSPIIKFTWNKSTRPDSKVRITVDTDKNSSNGYYYKDVAAGTSELVTNKFTGAGAFAGQTLTLAKNRAYNVSLKYNLTNEKSDWKTFKISSSCAIS